MASLRNVVLEYQKGMRMSELNLCMQIEENIENLNFYEISCWNRNDDQDERRVTPDDGPPVRKLFVGNLLDRTSQRDLRRFFSRFGKMKDCNISWDKQTGLRRNYGFVTFKSPEDAKKALNTPADQFQLFRRQFLVAPADSWHQPLELPNGKVQWKLPRQPQNEGVKQESERSKSPLVSSPREDEDIDESKCKINILNDDCLIHIFSFLGKRERIRIERVCKCWQSVCLNMWVYEQHLDFTSLFPAHDRQLTIPVLRGLLQRCGPNLASLDLSYRPNDFDHMVLTLVAKYTPNLFCLNLSGLPIVGEGVRALSRISQQLRKLNLDGCAGVQDRELTILFSNCPMLESVTLSHNNRIKGKCLIQLKNCNLTELVLNDCNNLHSKYLVSGLRGLKRLESLSFNSCINLTSSDVTSIIKTVPKLKYLSIARYFPLLNNLALSSVCALEDLISLQLHLNPAVNDDVLGAISKSCLKLQMLNITGCSIHPSGDAMSVTNDGVKLLARLPCLENLSVSYLANVTDEALDAIAENGLLKKLECRGSPIFTDAGCMRVVALCPKLECFDFCGCDFITNATIESAVEAVKLRTNNIKLTIIAGGTKVTHDAIKENIPLLEVQMADHSLAHLRPDFVDDIYFPPSDDDSDDDNDYCNGLIEFSWDEDSLLSSDGGIPVWEPWDHYYYEEDDLM